MPRMATTVHDRRTVVLAGALAGLVVLTGCSGDGPTDEEKTVTTSPMDSEEARAAAAALLEDAQVSLDAAFGGLSWEDSAPARETPSDTGCRITLPTRRCDVYLGRESAEHERIASALTEALESHGLPAAPTPTGGTGGWLTTSSTGEGVTLSFRAKGFSELTVHVDVAEECADAG